MLINESGLVRCIKRAYKSAGYAVAAEGDCMTIYTEQWYIQCKRAAIPRKVLATIVEHMGMIPDTEPVSIVKDGEPQLIMPDVAADEIAHWRTGERTDAVTMATVIMQGYQIFQPDQILRHVFRQVGWRFLFPYKGIFYHFHKRLPVTPGLQALLQGKSRVMEQLCSPRSAQRQG